MPWETAADLQFHDDATRSLVVVPRGTACGDVELDALTFAEGEGLERYETRARSEDPTARVEAVSLLGRVRFLRVGREAVPIRAPGDPLLPRRRR